MAKKNILITGATGYVGSSVLSSFLDHPKGSNLNITAVVRNADKAKKLKAFGVKTVVGSHTDAALVEKLVSENDYFINVADADSMEVAEAALKGFKKRYESTKTASSYIHISGTGVLADNAAGKHEETIWYDNNLEQLDTIDPEALHRNVELRLIEADKEGFVKVYIVSPPTIWGQPQNKLAKAGFTHTQSIQIPALIKVSLARSSGSYVGEGKNVWDNCHIDEVGQFFAKLYDTIEANPNTGHGREGVNFVRADEHNMYDVGKAIAQALHAAGKANSADPTPFTQEELDSFFGGFQRYFGCNARARGPHAESTGWKPTKMTKDFLENIKTEVDIVIASMEEPKPARRKSLLNWGKQLFVRKH
ncbi:hypothetical protein AX17_002452 [Amanita inopinata Kibby_2008]|nr:hypothetical protein AX17_002452 [Amanita inopinata Kibby_2008]